MRFRGWIFGMWCFGFGVSLVWWVFVGLLVVFRCFAGLCLVYLLLDCLGFYLRCCVLCVMRFLLSVCSAGVGVMVGCFGLFDVYLGSLGCFCVCLLSCFGFLV